MTSSTINRLRVGALAAAVAVLGGCANRDMSDLEQYAQQVLSRPGGRIEPLPEFKPYERYLYRSAEEGRRDPFEPLFEAEGTTQVAASNDAEMERYRRECQMRNREELENYELDSLRMVGTLERDAERWAIVLDPTGMVHRVQVGNYLGRNCGKVLAIDEDHIEVREFVEAADGGFNERMASLALPEE